MQIPALLSWLGWGRCITEASAPEEPGWDGAWSSGPHPWCLVPLSRSLADICLLAKLAAKEMSPSNPVSLRTRGRGSSELSLSLGPLNAKLKSFSCG